jgi:hypothetical protein
MGEAVQHVALNGKQATARKLSDLCKDHLLPRPPKGLPSGSVTAHRIRKIYKKACAILIGETRIRRYNNEMFVFVMVTT